MKFGIQILTLREMASDFASRVELTAAFGFAGLELHHWGPRPSPDPSIIGAEKAKNFLEAAGIAAPSTHLRSLSELERNYDTVTDFHYRLGVQNLILAAPDFDVYFNASDASSWQRYGERLNSMGKRLREQGQFLGLHNHVIELVPVSGKTGLELIFAECDQDSVFWEADVGHVEAAGSRLGDYATNLLERLKFLHVKDITSEGQYMSVHEQSLSPTTDEQITSPIRDRFNYEVNLGDGVIDLSSALGIACAQNVEWVFLEFHRTDLDLSHARRILGQCTPC